MESIAFCVKHAGEDSLLIIEFLLLLFGFRMLTVSRFASWDRRSVCLRLRHLLVCFGRWNPFLPIQRFQNNSVTHRSGQGFWTSTGSMWRYSRSNLQTKNRSLGSGGSIFRPMIFHSVFLFLRKMRKHSSDIFNNSKRWIIPWRSSSATRYFLCNQPCFRYFQKPRSNSVIPIILRTFANSWTRGQIRHIVISFIPSWSGSSAFQKQKRSENLVSLISFINTPKGIFSSKESSSISGIMKRPCLSINRFPIVQQRTISSNHSIHTSKEDSKPWKGFKHSSRHEPFWTLGFSVEGRVPSPTVTVPSNIWTGNPLFK